MLSKVGMAELILLILKGEFIEKSGVRNKKKKSLNFLKSTKTKTVD